MLNMSMLNKRSEEEIREIQEKKNLSDFIYQTNQSLQDGKFAHDSLKKSHLESIAKMDSHKKNIDISQELLSEKFDDFKSSILKLIQFHNESLERMADLCKMYNEKLDNIESSLNALHVKSVLNKDEIKSLDEISNRKDKELRSSIQLHRSQMESYIDSTRGYFEEKISKPVPEIQSFTDKLNTVLNEIEGFRKDLAYFKYNQCLMQRKLEGVKE